MLKRERYLKYIEDCLVFLAFRIKGLNSICLFDLNRISEDVYCEVLSAIFGWKLKNANSVNKNAKAIDLIDEKAKIVIQVSSDKGIRKVRNSLGKLDPTHYANYTFKFLSIADEPPQSWSDSDFKNDIPQGVHFNCKNDILGPNSLVQKCNDLKMDGLKRVYDACVKNFGKECSSSWPITVDTVKTFFSVMAQTIKFESRIVELCNQFLEMSGESWFKDDLLGRIKYLLQNQLRMCFMDNVSPMTNYRIALLGDRELLEQARLIDCLHDCIDKDSVENLSTKNIKNIKRAIEYEMKVVVKTLSLFSERLGVDVIDLNTEFVTAINE